MVSNTIRNEEANRSRLRLVIQRKVVRLSLKINPRVCGVRIQLHYLKWVVYVANKYLE